MARTSTTATIAEIYSNLGGTSPNVTGVTAVFDHEPNAWAKPVSVTITWSGQDATFWRIALRLYVQVDHDPATAWASLAALPSSIMAKLPDIGDDAWSDPEFVQTERGSHLVTTNVLEVPRADLSP